MDSTLTAGAIFTMLCGAIGALAKVYHHKAVSIEKEMKASLSRYEEKNDKANAALLDVSTALGEMKGRLSGHEQARADLGRLGELSASTLLWMEEVSKKQNKESQEGTSNDSAPVS